MQQIGEEAELNFSLYSRGQAKTITEEFQILVNKTGLPRDVLEEGKLRTVFKVSISFNLRFTELNFRISR
jgi:hypothetical protein